MGVEELLVRGKTAGAPGEDHIEIAQGHYGVFDGVTSRGRAVSEQIRIDGKTPGRWAALTLGETLHRLPAGACAAEAFAQLRGALHDGMRAAGVDADAYGWPAAAQACIFSLAKRQLWRLGDVSVAVNGTPLPETATPLDEPATAYRAAALWALLAGGADPAELRKDDPTWPMLLPLLELQHHLRNCGDAANPYAYWLLDGRPMPEGAVQVHQLSPGDRVVIVTDGYISPAATLREAEDQLARTIAGDPLLIGERRGFRPVPEGGDAFDDRAYLSFTV